MHALKVLPPTKCFEAFQKVDDKWMTDKWMTKITRILPSLRATKDMGAPLKKKSFQIYVTNEQNLSEKKTCAKKKWEYIIVDGAPQSDISLVRERNERTRCLHIINSPQRY